MMSKDSSAAGTDNHPPMLKESDYESWKIRIERYIKGKTHGKLIWKSILNGPSAHPQITNPVPTGCPAGTVMQPRDKRNEEFTDAENLKELCDIQASNILSQTLDRRKEDLFDKYERFHANGNELIQDYFVCFHKLINDMKVTKLTIPTHQMNTKFVNNLPPYRSKYVTSVKNIKNLSTDSYIELYTHLRSNEEHALKKLKKLEQSSSVVDPLAYLVKTTHQQAPTHSTTTLPSQLTPALASTSSSTALLHDDAMLATMKQIANLLSSFQKQFPPTNNQLRSSSNTGTHAMFNHEDAYDSDVDDEPNAAAAFMANLLSSSSQIIKVRTFNDNIFETVSPSWPSEYLAAKESQDVPTEASPILPTAAYMLQTLTDLTTQVEGHRKINQEQTLVNATLSAELDQCKLELARLKRNKVKLECDQVIVARNKRNAKLEQETELLQTTLRNKEATIASLTSLGFSNPCYSKKAQLAQPTLYDGHRLLQPRHAPVTIPDSHETLLETEVSCMKMSQKPGHVTPVDYAKLNALNSCDREHNRVLELDAEISKLHHMLKESKEHQLQERDEIIRNLESQFNISRMLNIGTPVGSLDKNALETEITQLKDNITSLRIQNDGYKIKIANQTRWYLELLKTSTHSRNTSNEKIGALNAEIAKIKPSGSGTNVSGPKTPEQPKVLDPRMYAIRMKPVEGISKIQSKSENPKPRVLPTKKVSARRIEDHHRNLNEINYVNVKRFGFVLNKNAVCDYCNKCLVSFTHNNCCVRSVNSMHAKKPQVACPKMIPNNVRKTDITVAYRIIPQWKPTGRQFILCDIYNPKKFKAHIAKPLELSLSGSSSSLINVLSSVPWSLPQNGIVERKNRTLMEAARTMLIFSKALLFLWAEVVATACYTLNRSLIHTLYEKTYYEMLKGKNPDLKYFRVFGALCYPTNDYDDVGKLNAKADIGIFVGYAPTKKAYQVFNKRTHKIQETIHVTFDELSGAMAPAQHSVGPELNALQSGKSHSDLVNDPSTPSVPFTTKQVEDLFRYDEDEEFPLATYSAPVIVNVAHAPEFALGSPSSTLISKGAPAASLNDSYIAPNTGSEASSSPTVNVDVILYLKPPHVQKWTKNHSLKDVIGDLQRPVSTRQQL
nr:retrovirus-related Pol polyprotein from transposon TNT 1-94 [Tanacetum cinerariifolium]